MDVMEEFTYDTLRVRTVPCPCPRACDNLLLIAGCPDLYGDIWAYYSLVTMTEVDTVLPECETWQQEVLELMKIGADWLERLVVLVGVPWADLDEEVTVVQSGVIDGLEPWFVGVEPGDVAALRSSLISISAAGKAQAAVAGLRLMHRYVNAARERPVRIRG